MDSYSTPAPGGYPAPQLWPCPRCGFYQPQTNTRCPQCGLQLAPEAPPSHAVRNVVVGVVAVVLVLVLLGANYRPGTVGSGQPPAASTFAALSEREWALVVKSPDAYIGRGYIIFACVTQFDSATGSAAFRANASWHREEYSFSGDNAWFEGSASFLSDVVEDDQLQMRVTVIGSYTYSTTLGGQMTVPAFRVNGIIQKSRCPEL